MGFVGFLKFALKCFHLLAWPLFAMVYPLCSSIRAIETNSTVDMRNLVAYWILFSLISLFELAFAKLIEWLPIWPSIKLMTICWLVLPHFEGAYYVYEHLVYQCLSLKPHVIKQFINPKEGAPLNAECFLAAAERYVKENGSEALEKLIATKNKHMEPNLDVEEIKVVKITDKKETTAATHSNFKDPKAKENPMAWEPREKNLAVAKERVERLEPNLAPTEERIVAEAGEIKGKAVVGEFMVGEIKVLEIPALEKVQKEWTCAVCQVTTTSETNLNDHLQGRKHLEKCEELKASKLVTKNKGCSPSTLNQEPKKLVPLGDSRNRNKTKKQEEKLQAKQSQFWCSICNVGCPDGVAMEAHLRGKKHLSRIQEMIDFSSSGWDFTFGGWE